MIVGVGADVVSLDRFAASLERTPTLRERVFTPAEEALAKALGAPGGLVWHDAEVVTDDAGLALACCVLES